jgi:hypothetical protein
VCITESGFRQKSELASRYFLDQNAAISAGTVSGLPINLKLLGIGNGLTVRTLALNQLTKIIYNSLQDPISQYPGYISYAKSNP